MPKDNNSPEEVTKRKLEFFDSFVERLSEKSTNMNPSSPQNVNKLLQAADNFEEIRDALKKDDNISPAQKDMMLKTAFDNFIQDIDPLKNDLTKDLIKDIDTYKKVADGIAQLANKVKKVTPQTKTPNKQKLKKEAIEISPQKSTKVNKAIEDLSDSLSIEASSKKINNETKDILRNASANLDIAVTASGPKQDKQLVKIFDKLVKDLGQDFYELPKNIQKDITSTKKKIGSKVEISPDELAIEITPQKSTKVSKAIEDLSDSLSIGTISQKNNETKDILKNASKNLDIAIVESGSKQDKDLIKIFDEFVKNLGQDFDKLPKNIQKDITSTKKKIGSKIKIPPDELAIDKNTNKQIDNMPNAPQLSEIETAVKNLIGSLTQENGPRGKDHPAIKKPLENLISEVNHIATDRIIDKDKALKEAFKDFRDDFDKAYVDVNWNATKKSEHVSENVMRAINKAEKTIAPTAMQQALKKAQTISKELLSKLSKTKPAKAVSKKIKKVARSKKTPRKFNI